MKFGCDRWPLHHACRVGDLTQVKYLVDVLNAKVNEPDDFDATPLYLAALTGHEDVCQFLLERGAKCDETTGDTAARVFYVALTPKLRNLLRQWSLSAASRDPFIDALYGTTKDPTHADCQWEFETQPSRETLHLHKIMLHAVCPRLLDYVNNDDHRVVVQWPHRDETLAALLVEYLYTGRCDMRDIDRATRLATLAIELQLDPLYDALQHSIYQHEKANNNSSFFSCTVQHNVKTSLARLAQRICRGESVQCSNLTLTWGGDRSWSTHTVFLCAHSDYFKCATRSGFREAVQATMDLTHLVPSDEVLDLAIQWMYCDSFLEKPSTLDVAVALVELGSAILCPRLCHYTAHAALIPALTQDNVFDMLELARLYSLERLEEKCVEVIAFSLDVLLESAELNRVLREEIRQTSQEGDVRVIDVPIAAEIRSNLRKSIVLDEEKLLLLDMLESALETAIAAEKRDERKKLND